MSTVLVIGCGGNSRVGFLEALAGYFDRVVVFDCGSSAATEYPPDVETRHLETLESSVVISEVGECKLLPDAVTTIFEPCVIAAAVVRSELGIKHGLNHRFAQVFRSKSRMAEVLESCGIESAFIATAQGCDGLRSKLKNLADERLVVIKPDMGYGNTGVRFLNLVDSVEGEVAEAICSAEVDVCHNRLATSDSAEIASDWIISRYASGREFEADILIVDGTVEFLGLHEKTVIQRLGPIIEENNAVTPPVSLSPSEQRKLEDCCRKLATHVASAFYTPCKMNSFCLYAEFIVRDDGEIVCLEFADRIGGGYVPYSIKKSTGIDLFDIAASCAAGVTPSVVPQHTFVGVYWQLLYSRCAGSFQEIRNLENRDSGTVLSLMERGFQVRVPQSDPVACLAFEGVDGIEACKIATEELRKLSVKVMTPNGVVESEIPTRRSSDGR